MSLSNYFLIISLVLNSALLMAVLGPLPFLLYLSVVLIVAMVWYIKRLIENISNMTQDIEELLDAVTLSDEVNINETELNNATSEEE